MATMSKRQAIAQESYRRAEQERHCLSVCLTVAIGQPDAVTWLERGNYRMGLVRPDAACGGYAMVVWSPGGQSPHVSAHYVDDLDRDYCRSDWIPSDRDGHDLRQLVAYLVVERNKLAGY